MVGQGKILPHDPLHRFHRVFEFPLNEFFNLILPTRLIDEQIKRSIPVGGNLAFDKEIRGIGQGGLETASILSHKVIING